MLLTTYLPPQPVDLRLTLGPLCRGRLDPVMRIASLPSGGVWRATRTPDGPATVHLRPEGRRVEVRAWGPGAAWAVDAVPDLLGTSDDPSSFAPDHPVVRRLHRATPGLRIPRSRAVLESLVPAVLEQKVIGVEARRAWRSLVLAHGEPAPGPAGASGLWLPPEPATLAALPYHAFHRHGVERRRAETIRRVAAAAARLERATDLPAAEARRLLLSIPGVGPWTAAEVAIRALGDADAVSVGDYHLPRQVAWVLAGQRDGDDPGMLRLLEPFRGHRGRVVRLVECAGTAVPRRASRMPAPWWRQRPA